MRPVLSTNLANGAPSMRIGLGVSLTAQVLAWPPSVAKQPDDTDSQRPPKNQQFGSVYLLRSGRFYKIGRSNAVGRREREIVLQLPEQAKLVHSITTDDPIGIEAYWHERFKGC